MADSGSQTLIDMIIFIVEKIIRISVSTKYVRRVKLTFQPRNIIPTNGYMLTRTGSARGIYFFTGLSIPKKQIR